MQEESVSQLMSVYAQQACTAILSWKLCIQLSGGGGPLRTRAALAHLLAKTSSKVELTPVLTHLHPS